MQKLQTVNAETLLYEPLEKPSFVVDSLIPTGLSLFCGSQKIGKSWLMLKLCLCVSQGIPLWVPSISTGVYSFPFDGRSERAASFCRGKLQAVRRSYRAA